MNRLYAALVSVFVVLPSLGQAQTPLRARQASPGPALSTAPIREGAERAPERSPQPADPELAECRAAARRAGAACATSPADFERVASRASGRAADAEWMRATSAKARELHERFSACSEAAQTCESKCEAGRVDDPYFDESEAAAQAGRGGARRPGFPEFRRELAACENHSSRTSRDLKRAYDGASAHAIQIQSVACRSNPDLEGCPRVAARSAAERFREESRWNVQGTGHDWERMNQERGPRIYIGRTWEVNFGAAP